MPLNLETASSGDGDFLPNLRFKATGGVFFMTIKDADGAKEEKRFANGFKAIFDMPNVKTGWARYNSQFQDFRADPSLDNPAVMPAVPADGGDEKWSRAFQVHVFSKDTFNGVLEFTHKAITVTTAFSELYAAWESQSADGMVPVVEVKPDPKKVGEFYAPSWSIVKMIERPATLPDADAPVAVAPAAAPAPAPAAAPSDEEF